jgi:RNA polymerase sigma factor (sigma-70 family)
MPVSRPAQAVSLARKRDNCVDIDSGDRAALLRRRDALVEAHLDLARSLAKSIAAKLPNSFELDDLISVGYIGLLHAATRYRPGAHGGAPFPAYARQVIRGAILDSVRRGHYVENTRASCTEIPEAAHAYDREAELDNARAGERLAAAVAQLGARHRAVVGWHYGEEELGLPAVGARLGVGERRAAQLREEAVRELRSQLVPC